MCIKRPRKKKHIKKRVFKNGEVDQKRERERERKIIRKIFFDVLVWEADGLKLALPLFCCGKKVTRGTHAW